MGRGSFPLEADQFWVVIVQFQGQDINDYTVEDHNDGTYTVRYIADGVCGPASLVVGCSSISNQIPGSPFEINFLRCEPPEITGAFISRNGVQLEIYFEYDTDTGGFSGIFDCLDLLSWSPLDLFGYIEDVYCYWRNYELLIVVFGNNATVLDGQNITLLGDFIRGRPPLDTPTLNETEFTITQYPDPHEPRILIVGPEEVSACEDFLRLDAGWSKGMGGRQYISQGGDTRIRWELVTPSDAYVSGVLADSYYEVELDVSRLQRNVYYEVTATATNYQRVTGTGVHYFIVRDTEIATVNIYAPSEIQLHRYQPLHLHCEAEHFCGDAPLTETVLYLWTVEATIYDAGNLTANVTEEQVYQNIQFIENEYQTDNPLLWLDDNVLLVGVEYTFTCWAWINNTITLPTMDTNGGSDSDTDYIADFLEGKAGRDSVIANVISAPLRACSRDGPVRRISENNEFVMDATCTIDPDDAGPIYYQWCCRKNTFPNIGRPCDNTNFPSNGFCSVLGTTTATLNFNSGSRQFQIGEYIFTLIVVQGSRQEEMEITINLIEDVLPLLHTKELESIFYGVHTPLQLEASVDPNDFGMDFEIAEQYWTVEPDYLTITDDMVMTADGKNSSFVVLKPNLLVPGVKYYFQYFLRRVGSVEFAWASIDVHAMEKPGGGFCDVTEDVDDPDLQQQTTNLRVYCREWEQDFGGYWYDMTYLNPTVDVAPYASLFASEQYMIQNVLLPADTTQISLEINNELYSQRKITITLPQQIPRPTFTYSGLLDLFNKYLTNHGFRRSFNDLYQYSNYFLHLVNLRQTNQLVIDGVYNKICIEKASQTDQERFYQIRSGIFQLFTRFFTSPYSARHFELLSFTISEAFTFCPMEKTQQLVRQVINFLTGRNLIRAITNLRITEAAGVFYQKIVGDFFEIMNNDEVQWFPGECSRNSYLIWSLWQNVSYSFILDTTPHLLQFCVQWDRVWTCQWKDLVENQLLVPRLSFENNGVSVVLPPEILSDLQSVVFAEQYDVLIMSTNLNPFDCQSRNEQTGQFISIQVPADEGVTPFPIENLNEDIVMQIPQLTEEGELQSDPNCKFWNDDTLLYSTSGVTNGTLVYYTDPVFPVVGQMTCLSDHLTGFTTLQALRDPNERDSSTGVLDIWWYVVLGMGAFTFLFIMIMMPRCYAKYRQQLQAEEDFYPEPPAFISKEMTTMGYEEGGLEGEEGEFEGEEEDWGEEEGDWGDEEYVEEEE